VYDEWNTLLGYMAFGLNFHSKNWRALAFFPFSSNKNRGKAFVILSKKNDIHPLIIRINSYGVK
jgi:hypothetical protein